jgi:hypothetical protein
MERLICEPFRSGAKSQSTEWDDTMIDDIIDDVRPRMGRSMELTELLWSHLLQRKVVNREIKQMIEASASFIQAAIFDVVAFLFSAIMQ